MRGGISSGVKCTRHLRRRHARSRRNKIRGSYRHRAIRRANVRTLQRIPNIPGIVRHTGDLPVVRSERGSRRNLLRDRLYSSNLSANTNINRVVRLLHFDLDASDEARDQIVEKRGEESTNKTKNPIEERKENNRTHADEHPAKCSTRPLPALRTRSPDSCSKQREECSERPNDKPQKRIQSP